LGGGRLHERYERDWGGNREIREIREGRERIYERDRERESQKR
jgi:hypothetical protein